MSVEAGGMVHAGMLYTEYSTWHCKISNSECSRWLGPSDELM